MVKPAKSKVSDAEILAAWDRVQALKKYSVTQALRQVADALRVSIERVAALVGVEP